MTNSEADERTWYMIRDPNTGSVSYALESELPLRGLNHENRQRSQRQEIKFSPQAKGILLCCVVVIVVMTVFMVLVLQPREKEYSDFGHSKPPKVCESESCLKATRTVISYMNTSYNPCEDFYNYACGQWSQKHKVDRCDFSTDTYTELTNENMKLVRNILAMADVNALEGTSFAIKKTKNFYKSCIESSETMPCVKSEVLMAIDSLNRLNQTNNSSLSEEAESPTNLNSTVNASVGITDPEFRTLACIKITHKYFPDVIAHLFMNLSFPSQKRGGIARLVDRVKSIFRRQNWNTFDRHTTRYIQDALSNLTTIIGSSYAVMNIQQLDKLYEKVYISDRGESYLANLERIQEAKVPSHQWSNYTTVANALYSPNKNELFIPAGIAREPFYSESYTDVLNYAKMGTTIAHELSHLVHIYIDNIDMDSVLRLPWFDQGIIKRSMNNFRLFKKCISTQYQSFHFNDLPTDLRVCPNITQITVDEDLADILGLKMAFAAFLDDYGPKPTIPEMESLTNEQFFFVAAAQIQCTAESEVRLFTCDEHSVENYRVMGSMMNLPEFSKAFNCPVGSQYNPSQRCQLVKT